MNRLKSFSYLFLILSMSFCLYCSGSSGSDNNGPIDNIINDDDANTDTEEDTNTDNQENTETDDGNSSDVNAKWTYMVYMGADNNLSSAGLGDIEEMGTVGSTSDLFIPVQAEFSTYYTLGMPNNNTLRLIVEEGSVETNYANSENIGNVDMGSPAALTAFIRWAAAKCTAEHYALVVWDHGGGWRDDSAEVNSIFRGAVQDETSGSFMSLPDLAKGVMDSGVHFDIINFDACLMAMYEVAYEFSGLTDYMVFSEEIEPSDGDPYDTILGDLRDNPDMSAADLAEVIVTRYDESYLAYTTSRNECTTKSAVDMSKLANLHTQVKALGAALLPADSTANDAAQAARSATREYTYPSNHDIYDLADYISINTTGAAKTAADNLKQAVTDMVTINGTNYGSSQDPDSHGLAIYLPLASETSAADLTAYSELACNSAAKALSASGTWGAYVEDGLLEGSGGTITYGTGGFCIKITWSSASDGACDADIDLMIIEPSGDVYAPWMGQTTPNGVFSSDSAESGQSEEYYLANSQVQTGTYYVVANYYDDGTSCDSAKVYLSYKATSTSDWVPQGTFEIMNLDNPVGTNCGTTSIDISCADAYSDWWIAGQTTVTSGKALDAGLIDLTDEVNIRIIIIKNKKRIIAPGY